MSLRRYEGSAPTESTYHTGIKKDGVRDPKKTLMFAREARGALPGARDEE